MARPNRPDNLATGEQPRHRGVVHRGRPRVQQSATPKKPFRDMTWSERWHDRRDRWLRVMPVRLTTVDAGFDNLLKVADREYYEITQDEAALLVARLRAWVDALDQSLQAGKVLYPSDLPAVVLDHELAPPTDAIGPPPPGLEGLW
jgi:hypothetical protein